MQAQQVVLLAGSVEEVGAVPLAEAREADGLEAALNMMQTAEESTHSSAGPRQPGVLGKLAMDIFLSDRSSCSSSCSSRATDVGLDSLGK